MIIIPNFARFVYFVVKPLSHLAAAEPFSPQSLLRCHFFRRDSRRTLMPQWRRSPCASVIRSRVGRSCRFG